MSERVKLSPTDDLPELVEKPISQGRKILNAVDYEQPGVIIGEAIAGIIDKTDKAARYIVKLIKRGN